MIFMMNSTATLTLLLLMTTSMFYVNGVPVQFETEYIPKSLRFSLNNNSEKLAQKENSTGNRRKTLSEPLEELNTSTIETTTVAIKRKLSSITKPALAFEAQDMKHSFVHPLDDDNDDISSSFFPLKSTMKPQKKIETSVTSFHIENDTFFHDVMMENVKHPILPANIFPANPDKSISDLPLEIQRKFTHEAYLIDEGERNATKTLDVKIVPVKSAVAESLSTPTVQQSVLSIETREEMVNKNSDSNVFDSKIERTRMPPGVIALLTAVGFATIAVVAYVGLIGWKRYQEYLHGHRELLVNDLDSNDINNFEL